MIDLFGSLIASITHSHLGWQWCHHHDGVNESDTASGIMYVFHVARILNKLSDFVFVFIYLCSFLWSFCFSCVQNKHIFSWFAVLWWWGDKKEADIIRLRDEQTQEKKSKRKRAWAWNWYTSPCVLTKLISNVKCDSLITATTITDLYCIHFWCCCCWCRVFELDFFISKNCE